MCIANGVPWKLTLQIMETLEAFTGAGSTTVPPFSTNGSVDNPVTWSMNSERRHKQARTTSPIVSQETTAPPNNRRAYSRLLWLLMNIKSKHEASAVSYLLELKDLLSYLQTASYNTIKQQRKKELTTTCLTLVIIIF